jgi:class 3 adenylate cyclase/tetratricopeptide (TPR) repeat protein
MAGLDDRRKAIASVLAAAAAACDRGEWASALAIAQAGAALDPEDPGVIAALARASAEGKTTSGARRRFTVMFCDLAGSTELSSALDPEDTRELLHAYHEACAAIVREHDGHIAHQMGDGVLIYFGYPRAHEDDAIRAVLTGLAISDAVGRLHSSSTGTPWSLKVRTGIHTGLAVVSDLGSGSWARPGDIVGETPNVAARIQTAAPTGAVLISADTLDLVRDRIAVEPLGPHSLRGIDRTIELFRVVSVRPDEDEVAPESVAVGREAERATLERAWAEASERGAYVVITGEPGIGKSHLVRHARSLVWEGQRSLVLRCSALHSNTPLRPVAQLLLALPASSGRAGAGAGIGLDRLARVAETTGLANEESLYLLAMMASTPWPADRPVPDLQPEQVRERTLTLLCAWIDALAAEGPLLLVFEDLHWADPSTLDLLQRCVTEPRPHPILVLVTTRMAAETVPGEPTAVLSLRSLQPAECDKLIDKLTGGRLDQGTRKLVSQRGDGVPLYIRELAMLEATGGPGPEQSAPPVPPTLTDLLVARLDSFPRERGIVDALAVIGRPAAPELVSEIAGRTTSEVYEQLNVLQHAGILRFSATPPQQYDFHHTLLRDAAYDLQLRAHRRSLHQRAAETLRAAYSATLDDHAEELAHHYQLAGGLEAAVSLWLRAAVRHASFAAHAEAIRSFELVLRNVGQLGGDQRELELRAQSGLAASLLASRGYTAPEVAAAYSRVRELTVAGDAQLEVSGLYGLWAYYHVTGDARASLETAETLLESASRWHDDQAELAARAVLGYQLQRLGRLTEARPLLQQGSRWDSPEPLFPHHPGIGAAANLAMTEWLLGDFAAARESIAQAVAAVEALDGPTAHFTRAYTHAFAAELFQVAGRPEVARKHAGRVVQVSSEFGFTSWLGAGTTNLKIAEALTSALDAIPTIEYCLRAWRGAGATSNLTQFGLGLALAYQAAGRTADALTAIEQACSDASDSQELYLEPELHRVRGGLLDDLRPDDYAGAAALEQALASAAAAGARALELRALVSLERRHRDRGDVATRTDAIGRLLSDLDPTCQDSERVLVEARALVHRETGT